VTANPVRGRPPDEQRILRSASRRIAIQITALFASALVVLGVIAAVFVLKDQHRSADHQLRQAVADQDAATDPPSGIVVYQQTPDGRIVASPDLRGRPLSPGDLESVQAGGPPITREIHAEHREYLVRTDRRGDATVQAAMELSQQGDERDRLLVALAIAGAFGLVLAGLLGWLIARRAIAPLGLALARQQRFVADASHELRTPLTQVHTRAQMIAQRLHRMPEAGPLTDDADRLVAGTRQLGEIIDEMLMAAQLRAEPARMQPVDLNAVARDAADAERERAESAGVALDVRQSDQPVLVNGVPSGLRRVVASLLDNALGHIESGGTVSVEVTRSGTEVRLIVADTGVGLGDVDPESLFERFARGSHGSGRRYGIGLALVREVVMAHGGTISAGSSEAGGAAFTVVLPAAAADPADQTGRA